jgi:hypothetical protein
MVESFVLKKKREYEREGEEGGTREGVLKEGCQRSCCSIRHVGRQLHWRLEIHRCKHRSTCTETAPISLVPSSGTRAWRQQV